MARHETLEQEQKRLAVEELVAAIEGGRIDAIEDLSPKEVALLLTRARPGEALADLFDRVRLPGGERE